MVVVVVVVVATVSVEHRQPHRRRAGYVHRLRQGQGLAQVDHRHHCGSTDSTSGSDGGGGGGGDSI